MIGRSTSTLHTELLVTQNTNPASEIYHKNSSTAHQQQYRGRLSTSSPFRERCASADPAAPTSCNQTRVSSPAWMMLSPPLVKGRSSASTPTNSSIDRRLSFSEALTTVSVVAMGPIASRIRRFRGRDSGQRNCRCGGFSRATMHRAKSRAVVKTVQILLAYLILWTPYNLLAFYNTVDSTKYSPQHSILDSIDFLNSLIVVNAIVNPLIYGVSL